MNVLSPLCLILTDSSMSMSSMTLLSMSWCCPSRPCVTLLACVHLGLFLALSLSPRNSLVSLWCDHSMLASLLRRCLTAPSLLHSFVFFPVHENWKIFLSPFILKASRRVSSFFLRVQLSQPYVATGHTSAFSSRTFVEIGMLWLSNILCSDAPITCPLFNLVPVRNSVVHSPSSLTSIPS